MHPRARDALFQLKPRDTDKYRYSPRGHNYLIKSDPLHLVVIFFPPGNILGESGVVHDDGLKGSVYG